MSCINLAQRTLGRLGGKHCKSLVHNEKWKGTKKITILESDQRFFAFVLSQIDLGNFDTFNM